MTDKEIESLLEPLSSAEMKHLFQHLGLTNEEVEKAEAGLTGEKVEAAAKLQPKFEAARKILEEWKSKKGIQHGQATKMALLQTLKECIPTVLQTLKECMPTDTTEKEQEALGIGLR